MNYKYIDWANINVKSHSALELTEIKRLSYYRYDPPNFHMLYFMLSSVLIMMASVFFAMHMHWWIFNLSPDPFPNYHRTGFWIGECIAFVGGIALLHYVWNRHKKSRKEWDEMEGIRTAIDTELKTR